MFLHLIVAPRQETLRYPTPHEYNGKVWVLKTGTVHLVQIPSMPEP